MPALSTLVDDFDDNVVNGTLWPGNYGTYSETGGRARVQCDPLYGAYASAAIYTLAGSSAFVRIYPPAAGGAATQAYAQMSLLSGVDGTEIGVQINRVPGTIRFQSNVDYFDASAVSITYDPVAHAYVRISEAGGTVTWATSPDGTAWTTRRTLATPAWAAASTTVELRLETRRDSGTNDFAEFDNLNTIPVTPPAGSARKAAFLAFL
ncbi:hypothetical protein AB0K66_04275 [Streptomyces werraensis]|uniref:hypothetical protein n=1 Tax=Streptomyces werraensis TaxID=68284 RepID=UPI00343F9CAE